jgi:predicted nuclease of predicted toxin-antitoxin system
VRWLADECVAAGLVDALRDAGHNVTYVIEVAPSLTDAEVVSLAQSEERLLLTDDKDFGDLIFRQIRDIPGVVLLRLDPARRWLQWSRVELAIERYGEKLYGRYTVIEEARFRSRPLPK